MARVRRIRTGQLRHKLVVLTPLGTKDKWGEVSKSTTIHSEIRASITPITADDKERGAGVDAEITHIIRTHYVSGITSKMQLQYGSRMFNIKGIPINVEEKNKVLEIMAIEQEAI